MTSPRLLFHTLKHLKPRQFVGRFWFHLYRPRPVPVQGATTRASQQPLSLFLPVQQSVFNSQELQAPIMRFLGDELAIDGPETWNKADKPKLFLYNVHYFDDLNAEGCEGRTDIHDKLIEQWIAENPAPLGNGWEPYPLSLRIVNWVQYFSRRGDVPRHWLDSLATQATYLSRRLEYHLLGNHLFTNAKALVFAGSYLDKQEKLLHKGLDILDRQLPEQVLADGAHFELSPMYHCIAMADFLDLLALSASYPAQIPAATRKHWTDTVVAMFMWLHRMRHPDGEISLFNDAAMDIAPGYESLANYARTLDIKVTPAAPGIHHAPQSGYVTMHNEEVACMLDIGRIGPDYIPGHAHADSLSFELSLYGQRLICDSGTSVYGDSDERLRQRGTAAHNTVLIDNENSSEVWSGFRVARRAYPVEVDVRPTHEGLEVSAAHTGYRRLKGRNVHHRSWSIDTTSMTIKDSITGAFSTASASYHLHPDVLAKISDEGILLTLPAGQRVQFTSDGRHAQLAASTWHPKFGETLHSQKIIVPFDAKQLTSKFNWNTSVS